MRLRLPHFSKILLIVTILLASISAGVLSATPAQAARENPADIIERDVQAWLTYRGIWGDCTSLEYIDTLSKDDVLNGNWFKGMKATVDFGYLTYDFGDEGDDTTISMPCSDGSAIDRFMDQIMGFKDEVEAFCVFNDTLASNDEKNILQPEAGDDKASCEGSNSFSWGSRGDEYREHVRSAFTDLLDAAPNRRPQFELKSNDSDQDDPRIPGYNAWKYWIGKRSLEVMCGQSVALSNGETDSALGNHKVVSAHKVDYQSGAVERINYGLGGSRLDDEDAEATKFKARFDGNSHQELSCAEMATRTRNFSKYFSAYVIDYYNYTLADDLIAALPQFTEQINKCRDSSDLQDPMSLKNRKTKFQTCLSGLPEEFQGTIATTLNLSEYGDRKDVEAVEGGGGETNSCAVDGVGWVVCPVLNFMATINEEAFDFISAQLEIKPELLADSETRAAWSSFRDLANVAFVIAFLVIIYSQITGAGISNYGLKKMLPKLIVAAVLVNSSYILCQIAVDLSNIIGGSTYSFFKDIPITDGDGTVSGGGGPRGWKDVVSAILILGLAAAALVLAASTLGVAALLAFMLVILILVARKALLILLIVISPLAFVAYLLPNTEQWFKKWWKTFSTLLMLFPTVGLIFGASFLASRIVGNSPGGDGDGDGALFIQITALGIMAIPLFAIPIVLKGAMAAAGAVGAKLSGGLDKATGAAGNKGKERYKNSAYAQGRAGRKELKQKYKQGKLAEAMADPTEASWYNRRRARAARGITGRGYTNAGEYAQDAMVNRAIVESDKIYDEGVKGASLRQYGMANNEVAVLAATGKDLGGKDLTEHEHAAAVERIMKTGSFEERRAVLENLASNKGTTSAALRTRAVQGAIGRGDQNIYGVDFANKIVSEGKGTINSAGDLRESTVTNAVKGKVSGEHLVQSEAATSYLVDSLKTSTDPNAGLGIGKVKSEAVKLGTNPTTASKATPSIKGVLRKL